MKRINWWWVALAGVVAVSVPAAITLAQSPEAEDETFEAPVGGLAWGMFDPAGDDEFTWEEEVGGGGGGGMERHFVMRRGPGGGGGMGMGGGHGMGGHGMGMGRGHGMRFAMRLHALDLTDDQKTKIEAIHDRAMRKNIQSRADLKIVQLDLHKLLRADNPDRRAVEAQIDKLSAMQTAMHKAHLGVMFEARSLLTDAQKKQLQEMGHGRPGMGGPHMRHGGAEGSPSPDSHHGSQ